MEFWETVPADLDALVEQFKDRENLRQGGTARLTAMVAGMFRDKNSTPPSPDDFLPFRPPPRYMTVGESEEALRMMALRINATIGEGPQIG